MAKRLRVDIATWSLIGVVVLIYLVQCDFGVVLTGAGRGDDAAFATSTFMQFRDELAAGVLTPKWSFAGNFGLGSPIFFFYPPAAYYFSSFIGLFMPRSPEASVLGVAALAFAGLGIVTCAMWARLHTSRVNAIAAGAIYALTPYVALINPQRRFAFAEMAATPLWPLAFLAVDRGRDRVLHTAVYVAPVVALFALVHVPSWILCVGLLPVYAVFKGGSVRDVCLRLAGLGLGVVVGVGVAAVHIGPAFVLQGSIPVGNVEFGYTANLMSKGSLSTGIGKVRDLCLIAPVAAACGFAYFARRRRGLDWPVLATLGVAVLLATPLAEPLWLYLPPLHRVGFPWRLLGPISLFAAVAIATYLPDPGSRARTTATAVFICLGLAMAGVAYKLSAHGVSAAQRTTAALDFTFSQTPEYFPAPPADRAWIALQKAGVKSSTEALRLQSPCLADHPLEPRVGQSLTVLTSRCVGDVRLPIFGFPGWTARAGDARVPLRTERQTGLLIAHLPRPGTNLVLTRERLPIETTSLRISAIAVFLWLLGCASTLVFATHLASRPTSWHKRASSDVLPQRP